MVYGGQDVARQIRLDPTVLVNGPGRTKIVITAEQDWRDYLDVIVDSIANLGGMACVNATAVLYEGDPAPLAQAIAERLSEHRAAAEQRRTSHSANHARRCARALARVPGGQGRGHRALLGADQVVADLGDGYAALRPAVHLLAGPDVRHKLNVELPIPVRLGLRPGRAADGMAALRDSLVSQRSRRTTADRRVWSTEPTRDKRVPRPHANIVIRPRTFRTTGFSADFLMRNKGFIGG